MSEYNGIVRGVKDAVEFIKDLEVRVEELEEGGGGGGAVSSVNGKTGAVTLNASDVGALPSSTVIPPQYTLPAGSATVRGGFKVGSGLSVSGDVLSATGGGGGGGATEVVSVKDYGAVGDGVTNDTVAIANAIAYMNDKYDDLEHYHTTNKLKGTLLFPEDGIYLVTDTLTAFGNYNIEIRGAIRYNGADNKTCFKIGNDTSNMTNCNLILNAYTTGENVVAFELVNLLSCRINVGLIHGFYEALRCVARNDLGFCGNRVDINVFSYNTHDIHLLSETSGWSNANHFVGGFFYKFNNAGVPQTCIRISSPDNTYFPIDSNLFEGHNLEEGKPTTVPISLEAGVNNTFNDIRVEMVSDDMLAYVAGDRNIIGTRATFATSTRIVTSENQNGYVRPNHEMLKIYDSGFLADNMSTYSGSTARLYNKNFGFRSRFLSSGATSISDEDDLVVTSGGLKIIGELVEIAHRFAVKNDKYFRFVASVEDSSKKTNFAIRCFDASMTQLPLENVAINTNNWNSDSYVKTSRYSPFYPNVNIPYAGSGSYYTPTNNYNEFNFEVHPDVKFLEIYTVWGFSDTATDDEITFQRFEMYSGNGSAILLDPSIDRDDYVEIGKTVYDKSYIDGILTPPSP